MSILTDRATAEHWKATGKWVEFAQGAPVRREFRQIMTPRGYEGVFAWFAGDERLCDHEHNEDERSICEDARSARPVIGPPVDWTEPAPCETCSPPPHGSGECQCAPCESPAYGHPAHAHCAACCGGSMIAEYAHNCPIADHAEWAERQNPRSGCPDCKGSGKQRLAVHVPCDECGKGHVTCPKCGEYYENRPGLCDSFQHGLVTVAWAIQEWGPLPVVWAYTEPDFAGIDRLRIHDSGTATMLSGRVWKPWDLTDVTLPPDVDTASLIGQWARGGRIEPS